MNYEYEKYITDNNNILETLNKYGVAIIPNIINQQECDAVELLLPNYQFQLKKTNTIIFISTANHPTTLNRFNKLYKVIFIINKNGR